MPNLTSDQQQVFSLSWLSCGVAANTWSQADLQNQIDALKSNADVKKSIPTWNWKVVWGPFDFITGNKRAVANAMFVAQQLDASNNPLPTYVVAMSATNTKSFYDIMTEDLEIAPITWPYANNTALQVTTGDTTGVQKLLDLPGGTAATAKIQNFLNSIPNKENVTLWFTGHSLAGALSPMLMLALMDPKSTLNQSPSTYNTSLSQWKQVNLLATASPSVGNQAFLSYFQGVFSAPNASTTFIWNGSDVVPHAWNNTTMAAITTPKNIYNVDFLPGSCVGAAIKKEQKHAAQYNYALWQPTPGFTYGIQPYSGNGWTPEGKFLAQMDFQHIAAYVYQFGCTWFTPATLLDKPVDCDAAALTLCTMLGNGVTVMENPSVTTGIPTETPSAN